MKNYNFEKFDGLYPRGDNKIAINNNGLIRLSSGFCRVTNVKNFKYVVLFFDKSNNAIAFKFTNISEDGAFKLTRDKHAITISATTFLKAKNLYLRSYFRRYYWNMQNLPKIGEVYIIELRNK